METIESIPARLEAVIKNSPQHDEFANNVQRRKEELFQKRQEELKAKLQVKEARRQMLTDCKWSYTPKRRIESVTKQKNQDRAEQPSFSKNSEMFGQSDRRCETK